ncbi:MAG: hypothetical protein Q8K46_06780, partial [Deltaproteobacteria bacterium]|nr:hypothetical protein [Deltaproteobacteria bacterium]
MTNKGKNDFLHGRQLTKTGQFSKFIPAARAVRVCDLEYQYGNFFRNIAKMRLTKYCLCIV